MVRRKKRQLSTRATISNKLIPYLVAGSALAGFVFIIVLIYSNLFNNEKASAGNNPVHKETAMINKIDRKAENAIVPPAKKEWAPIRNLSDIQLYLDNLDLEKKYDKVKLYAKPGEPFAVLTFYNPDSHPFQLDLFNVNGNKFRTYLDIVTDYISINKDGVEGDGNTYLLKDGKGKYFAGKLLFDQ